MGHWANEDKHETTRARTGRHESVMNDTTSTPPEGNAPEFRPQQPTAPRDERRPAGQRPRGARQVGASLGEAAGADALRALQRELRQARGESADEAPANAEGGESEFAAPGQAVPRQGRRAGQPGQDRRNQGGRGKGGPRGDRANERGPRGHAGNAGDRGRGRRDGERAAPSAPVKPARPLHPVIAQLAQLYPQLFGDQPMPLKRGIYQDLVAVKPEGIELADLKVALGIHTRSFRYLNAVSQGKPRHDLQGQVVEAMAPEHVHHALLEVFRRRKPRDGEDMAQKLRRRIALAFDASGLTRESYDLLVRGRNAEANAALDDAMTDVAERDAKAEATRRTFEASGQTPEAFAEMYGMRPQAVQQALTRCAQIAQRQTRELPVKGEAQQAAAAEEAAVQAVADHEATQAAEEQAKPADQAG